MTTQRLTNEIIIAAIEGFEAQKNRLDGQIAELRSFLTGNPTEIAAEPARTGKRGKFSEATKLKMKAAQLRRWAKIKGDSAPSTPAAEGSKPKRQLSEAGRQAIAEAARKRWAATKAAKPAPVSAVSKKSTGKKAATKKAAGKKAAKVANE